MHVALTLVPAADCDATSARARGVGIRTRTFTAASPPAPSRRNARHATVRQHSTRPAARRPQLRKWADVLVVAPLSANTLAKLAAGLSDNLLTCIARAWDFRGGKPVVVAPAMNTAMWEHPLTAAHLRVLTDVLGVAVVPPATRALACGDVGAGAMAAVGDVVGAVRAAAALGLGGKEAATTQEEHVSGGGER